jgi:hypothetical protein
VLEHSGRRIKIKKEKIEKEVENENKIHSKKMKKGGETELYNIVLVIFVVAE